VSEQQLEKVQGAETVSKEGKRQCKVNGKTVLGAELRDSMHVISEGDFDAELDPNAVVCAAESELKVALAAVKDGDESTMQLWHKRWLHTAPETLKKVAKCVIGMESLNGKTFTRKECGHCMRSYLQNRSFARKIPLRYRPSNLLELLHFDIAGPLVEGIGRKRYFMVVTDDASRFVETANLGKKSDAGGEMIRIILRWERATGQQVVRANSDVEAALMGEFLTWATERGTRVAFHPPGNPNLTGVSESQSQMAQRKAACRSDDD
jgi:hypothetical protein